MEFDELALERYFSEISLQYPLKAALINQGITKLTDVQIRTFEPIYNGDDVIIRSETGSGKTLAYLLPIISKLDFSLRKTQAIIIAPTRELANQIHNQVKLIAGAAPMPELRSALIIGSANKQRQIEALKEKPQIVIGSAGRILELIKLKKISAHTSKTIVLDEADRLLDEQNADGVKAVIKTTLADRQLVLLSATMPPQMLETAKSIMKNPTQIFIKNEALPDAISHMYIICQRREKIIKLRKLLHCEGVKKAVIFINNPENIAVTVEKLNYHNIKAVGVYGGFEKNARKNGVEAFREGRATALVTSELSARGLDFKDVTHVINLDMPEDPIFYLHRAGRTGRSGNEGACVSLVTPYEKGFIPKYQKNYGISFKSVDIREGKIVEKKTEKNTSPRKKASKKFKSDKNTPKELKNNKKNKNIKK